MAKKTNVPLKRRRRSELNVKLIAIIAAVLFVVTIGIVSAVIGSHKKEKNPSVADSQNNETTAEPTTEEETTTKVPTIEVNLMMIGDMLMHEGVVKSGLMDDETYNFDHLYTNIAKDISSADIKIVNQETILGGSDFAYTGYPTFNSPWALGDAEVKAGFNIILHATNHTLDKGLKGVENCLSFWKTYHPDTTVLGINETEEDYENIYVYEKEGFKIAFLNYTYGTNGICMFCARVWSSARCARTGWNPRTRGRCGKKASRTPCRSRSRARRSAAISRGTFCRAVKRAGRWCRSMALVSVGQRATAGFSKITIQRRFGARHKRRKAPWKRKNAS